MSSSELCSVRRSATSDSGCGRDRPEGLRSRSPLRVRVVGIDELAGHPRQASSRRSRTRGRPATVVEGAFRPRSSSRFRAELAHQLGLRLDERSSSPRLNDADAVGHLLGLLDVMGRQHDRDALSPSKLAHEAATCRAGARHRPRPSARRGTGWSARARAPWRSGRRRFMPPDSVMILAARFSQSDRSRRTFSMNAVVRAACRTTRG